MTVYIDRDEVLKKAWDADTRCGYVQVVDVSDIESAPTADVMKVKYGRWVYDPDGMDWNIGAWRCSECGCKNGNLGSYSSTNPYHCAGSKFCGNCGAKMTGDIKSTEICLATGLECSKCTPGPCSSRNKAIKDFQEKLKELYKTEGIITDDMTVPLAVIRANIDDIAEEMIGDK